MRHRNRELHADIERIVDFKMLMLDAKSLAKKHHTSPATIRSMVCQALKLRKVSRGTSQA